MANFIGSKKVLWLFVIVGAIAVIAALIVALTATKRPGQKTANSNANLPPAPQVKKEVVANNQLPDLFPADFPMEANAKIVQNFNGTDSSGKFLQATRTFVTAKTLDQNFTIYQSYFQKNGWTITTSSNLPMLKSLTATKGKVQISVTMSENSLSHVKTVDITATQLAK